MIYEWDEAKREANRSKHGIDFDEVRSFVWETAEIKPSPRGNEMRYAATGYIGPRLHRVIYTERGERLRIISVRKAHLQEVRDYDRPR